MIIELKHWLYKTLNQLTCPHVYSKTGEWIGAHGEKSVLHECEYCGKKSWKLI